MKRFETLDSLRGLAALSVLLFHLLSIFPAYSDALPGSDRYIVTLIKYTPLSVLVSGHSAVILFFVLSGFVLALPFLGGRQVEYRSFLLKRICRVYIPYWFALAVALWASAELSPFVGEGWSEWFAQFWQQPVGWRTIVEHVILIGPVSTDSIDFVVWSLVHEARLSLVFPLLMLVITRWEWRRSVLAGLLLSLGTGAALFLLTHWTGTHPANSETLHYTLMFLAGALLAKQRKRLTDGIAAMSRWRGVAVLIAAVCLYTYPSWCFPQVKGLHVWIWDDWLVTAGSCLFLLLALGSPGWQRMLQLRPLVYLGKISYSLYLLHPIVLLFTIRHFDGQLPLPALAALCIPLSLLAAACMYHAVEVPSLLLGRRLSASRSSERYVRQTDLAASIARYESR